MHTAYTRLSFLITALYSIFAAGMDIDENKNFNYDHSATITKTLCMPFSGHSDLRVHVNESLYSMINPDSGTKSHGSHMLPDNLSVITTRLFLSRKDNSFAFRSIEEPKLLLKKQPSLTLEQIKVITYPYNNCVIVDESQSILIKINGVLYTEDSYMDQISEYHNEHRKEKVRLVNLLMTAQNDLENCDKTIEKYKTILEEYIEKKTRAEQENSDLKKQKNDVTHHRDMYKRLFQATSAVIGSYLLYLLACKIRG
jgi:hypothetical protein